MLYFAVNAIAAFDYDALPPATFGRFRLPLLSTILRTKSDDGAARHIAFGDRHAANIGCTNENIRLLCQWAAARSRMHAGSRVLECDACTILRSRLYKN